ncbi:SMP-30/gluconolactonase/LRE family protein [Acinetobacter qingfengensis]|uniref:Transcriptional regulator n=1 Tax=Acinetobacter qingfengensis TaxID=1262585 RepID=A0A1E7RC36_9GAMM|nr:SMP-30/gluconolactonase/LRE family protein [Acinetobacter qingfengensis]KAA8735063.1 SMP-30/gluconolactonase/LRE family protein [Acinetobacter qingfengensis]OEY97019.1 transcriptional regulator [Acinetobacter qingfengensis]
MSITYTRISHKPDLLGESPVWDAQHSCLYWVDSVGCYVRRYIPSTQQFSQWKTPSSIGCVALGPKNSLITGLSDGFYQLNLETGTFHALMQPIPPNPEVRFNDGRIDRYGNFVCGSMGVHAKPVGELYRLNRNGDAERLANGIRISNSIAFSPDGTIFYFADSLDQNIRAYEYGDGQQPLTSARIFAETSILGSAPDGATVDAEGYLWVALVQAGKIARFSPDGVLDRLIKSPVDMPSCLAFGGDDLATLFVTSIKNSGTGRIISRHPDGGFLFSIHGLGVQGIAEPRYQQ